MGCCLPKLCKQCTTDSHALLGLEHLNGAGSGRHPVGDHHDKTTTQNEEEEGAIKQTSRESSQGQEHRDRQRSPSNLTLPFAHSDHKPHSSEDTGQESCA